MIKIQCRLRANVITVDLFEKVSSVAGVDVGYAGDGGVARAAIVVMSFPDLNPLDEAQAHMAVTFPYIAGLLSFREIPVVLEAFKELRTIPDLLLCDGQGLAHPRRFGLACHLGVLLDIPSIGVAKSRLVGTHARVDTERGNWQPLVDGEDVIGSALRTRHAVKPVYVSIGHRISLETAIDTVLRCAPKYRLPEPIRGAHRLASREP